MPSWHVTRKNLLYIIIVVIILNTFLFKLNPYLFSARFYLLFVNRALFLRIIKTIVRQRYLFIKT
jgi:hypothetical protein